MATAVIAFSRIAQYRASGRPLPEGAAMDAAGAPTTDPAVATVPLPVGGAKGAGMSLVFELLAGCLTANPVVSAYHAGTPEGRRHRRNATMIAVDGRTATSGGSAAERHASVTAHRRSRRSSACARSWPRSPAAASARTPGESSTPRAW
ncbi:Ldh family oxidoreductase [Actinoallomurus oryzae]|uniref:Ldh family oxidoreductase n=1 Tax=Actinoallomurus oryzae TaxID=502180 RepID=UPI003CD0BC1F